ncbi:response regulator [Marinoscillum sp.]|uniref:response regulator n=1 Tax=Marinoscillum sp. TaxID=2024838 RepID=UPI003BAA7F30
MAQKNKIIIADDHVLFIEGLKVLLADHPEFEIIATANTGKVLLSCLADFKPDLILLDINMPDLNGLEALKKLHAIYPYIKVVMLSTYNEQYLIDLARKSGAKGYLIKTTPKEKLVEAIAKVCAGGEFYPEGKKEQVKSEMDKNDGFLKQFNLTKRELEIMQLVKEGMTSQEIADQLVLSVLTVRTHRKNLMQKLNLSTPGALVKFMMDHNL